MPTVGRKVFSMASSELTNSVRPDGPAERPTGQRTVHLRWLTAGIALFCLCPLVLLGLGVDFSTGGIPFVPEGTAQRSPAELVDTIHHALRGSFTHTLLEWTAFCAACLVAVLALVHYRLVREPSLPIIGMAMASAGAMDAFHTLAADRLIDAVADNRNLIPFTWAICRLFNAMIMLVGVGIFVFSSKEDFGTRGAGFVIAGAARLSAATAPLCASRTC